MISAYALYRRSRAHQDLSVEEQRQEIGRWATQHGYEIVQEFADDRSGLDTSRRRGFLALLDLCSDSRRRVADVVLVYDVSRFSRLEPDEAAFHEFTLRQAGVRVIYTHEPGANEAGITGHLMKSLKRVMAYDYSLKLSQVVTRGLRAHAERGLWVGGQPAYGLRRGVRQPDGSVLVLPPGRWKARSEAVVLVPDPFDAEIVVQIYQSYVGDKGLVAIATMLNSRGIPAPRGGVAWTKGTLWAILRNPIYKGTVIYGKARYSEIGKRRGKARRPESDWIVIEDAAPAIIPVELWMAAQAKHGTRKFGVGRPWHRPYLLSGLVVCDHCGKRFRAHKQTRGLIPAYYVCGSYVASGAGVCDGLRVSTPFLDTAVIDGIQKRIEKVLDRETLTIRLQELLRADTGHGPSRESLEARLKETDQKIERLVDALASGADNLRSVRTRLAELELERRSLEAELAQTRRLIADSSSHDIEATVDALIDALQRFPEVLAAGEPEERKAVVRAFLQEIRIEKTTRQAVLRWHRLPRVGESLKLVELRGLELERSCGPRLHVLRRVGDARLQQSVVGPRRVLTRVLGVPVHRLARVHRLGRARPLGARGALPEAHRRAGPRGAGRTPHRSGIFGPFSHRGSNVISAGLHYRF